MHTQHHDELKFVSGNRSYVQIFNGTRQDVKAENQLRHSNDIHLASNDTGQSGGCFLKFETPMILGYKLTFPDILERQLLHCFNCPSGLGLHHLCVVYVLLLEIRLSFRLSGQGSI